MDNQTTLTVTKRDAIVAGATAGTVILVGTIVTPILLNKVTAAAVSTMTLAKSKAGKKAKKSE